MKCLFGPFVKAVMPGINKHYKREQKLFVCDTCEDVIEIYATSGKYREAHFQHLPKIHLERKTCLKCKKKKEKAAL